MPFALIPILASLVPEAVKWIAGDTAGKAAATVTDIATKVLGTDDPAKAEAAIAADPAKALEFKLAVLAAQSAAEKEETARMLAELADRQSARMQTIELAKSGSGIAWGAPVVSVLAVLVFGGFVYLLFSRALPPGMESRVDLLTGAAITGYSMVLAYWLGSSSGSTQKTATLEKLIGSLRR